MAVCKSNVLTYARTNSTSSTHSTGKALMLHTSFERSHLIFFFAFLRSNTYFGEYNLLYGTLSDVSVRTLEFCDTSSLSKPGLDQILVRFPDMQLIIRHSFLKSLLRKRLMTGELQKLTSDRDFMTELDEIVKTGKVTKLRKNVKYSDSLLRASGFRPFTPSALLAPPERIDSDYRASSNESGLLQQLVLQMEKQGRRLDEMSASIIEIKTKLGSVGRQSIGVVES